MGDSKGRLSKMAKAHFSEGVLTLNEEFQVTMWSQELEGLFGLHQSDCLGNSIFDLLVDWMPENFSRELDRVLKGESRQIELRRKEDSSIGPLHLFLNPVFSSPEQVSGVAVRFRPVLPVSDPGTIGASKFRFLASHHEDVVIIIDCQGWDVVFMNRDSFLGYVKEELSRQGAFMDFVHPDDEEKVASLWQTLLSVGEKRPKPLQFRIKSQELSWHWVNCEAEAVEAEGEVIEVMLALRITGREKVGDIPFDSQDSMLDAMEMGSSVGIFVTDFNADRIYISSTFDEVCNLSFEETFGHTEEQKGVFWDWYETLENNENYHKVDSHVRPDGQVIWMTAKAAPMWDEDDLIGYIGTLENITERRKIENRIIKSEHYQRIINYFATSLLGKNTLEELLQDVTESCVRNLDFEECVIYLLDEEQQILLQKAGSDSKSKVKRGVKVKSLPLGKGIVGWVAQNRKAQIVSDLSKDSRYVVDDAVRKSEITVPIIFEGNVIGVIDSEHSQTGFFNSEHLQLLETIASLCASKIIRVKSEHRTRRSQERVELALEGGNLGLWDWEIQTGYITYNRRWAEMLGYSLEEIEPNVNNWDKVMHPDDKPKIMEALSAHLEGKTAFYESEHRLLTKSGSWKWILDRGKVVKKDLLGKPLRVSGTHLDITARKKAEAALRESEEKFKSAFRYASVGMVLSTIDGIIYQVNPAFCEMVGYRESEILGANSTDLTLEEDKDLNAKKYQELISGKINSFFMEKRYSHKKGYTITGLLSCSLVRSLKGEPLYVISQVQDITDRKNTEEELRRLTEELLKSNVELNQFAYITSHNLRAPVVNLVSLLDLYDKNDLGGANNQIIIDKVEACVGQLSSTLDDLVQIVAIKNEAQREREDVVFANLLKGVHASIEGQISKSGASIVSDFSKAESIRYPKSHLESILLNFITNALKYKSPKRLPRIQITTEPQDDYICLTFSDNGMGIDLERFGKDLFGLYKRFHAHVDGKGLGLYIVKSQVEALGGKVEVVSELGKGTTFRVYLTTK